MSLKGLVPMFAVTLDERSLLALMAAALYGESDAPITEALGLLAQVDKAMGDPRPAADDPHIQLPPGLEARHPFPSVQVFARLPSEKTPDEALQKYWTALQVGDSGFANVLVWTKNAFTGEPSPHGQRIIDALIALGEGRNPLERIASLSDEEIAERDAQSNEKPVAWRKVIDSAYELRPRTIFAEKPTPHDPDGWEPLYAAPPAAAPAPSEPNVTAGAQELRECIEEGYGTAIEMVDAVRLVNLVLKKCGLPPGALSSLQRYSLINDQIYGAHMSPCSDGDWLKAQDVLFGGSSNEINGIVVADGASPHSAATLPESPIRHWPACGINSGKACSCNHESVPEIVVSAEGAEEPEQFGAGWKAEACESIDAGFFSGNSFHDPKDLARIEWYMGRWQREIVNIKQTQWELEADEVDSEIRAKHEDDGFPEADLF